jgi:hypothetical protein
MAPRLIMNSDTTTTLAGGAAGLQLLMTVQYSALPSWSEFTKIAVAFSLMFLGYLMYRKA